MPRARGSGPGILAPLGRCLPLTEIAAVVTVATKPRQSKSKNIPQVPGATQNYEVA